MITKNELDELVTKYETTEFIKDDPIQFPHRYTKREDIEIAGFIASLFAYGNRKMFIKKLNDIFLKSESDLSGFIKFGEFSSLSGIEYRFSKDYDIIPIFEILSDLYNSSKGLSELFEYGYKTDHTILSMLNIVIDYFYSKAPKTVKQGFYHMLPNPHNGGAMKRMNMFLRWMVRTGPVDLGIWNFIPKTKLLIPLDVHVARLSRQMKLLKRKSNDFEAVIDLTNQLKEFCPEDPIKYDFGIFGLGVSEINKMQVK